MSSNGALIRPVPDSAGGMDLIALWNVLWGGKWLVLLSCTAFGAMGLGYGLMATKWYRAEIVLIPVKNPVNALTNQISGLANIVGLNVGAGTVEIEPLAVLRSRAFARSFIEENDLLPVLFAEQWDPAAKAWRGEPEDWPDVRDGVVLFDNIVRNVSDDRRTGLVVLAVEWTDATMAATWAAELADLLNVRMSERARAQAEANIEYLQAEIAATNLVPLQQPIGRLLELELQKLMLAKNSSEYAYRIVDDPVIPKTPIRPRPALTLTVAAVLGGMIAVFALIVMNLAPLRGPARGEG